MVTEGFGDSSRGLLKIILVGNIEHRNFTEVIGPFEVDRVDGSMAEAQGQGVDAVGVEDGASLGIVLVDGLMEGGIERGSGWGRAVTRKRKDVVLGEKIGTRSRWCDPDAITVGKGNIAAVRIVETMEME